MIFQRGRYTSNQIINKISLIIENSYLIPMKTHEKLQWTMVNMAASLSHINDCLYIPQFMLRWLIIVVIECYRSKFDSPICWWLYQSYHPFSETFIVEHRKIMKNRGWLKNDVILPIFPVVDDFPYYWMVPSGKLTVRPWQSSGLED